jgi:hypothetical protein
VSLFIVASFAVWTGNDVSGTFVLFNASTSQQTFYLWLTTGFQLWEVVGDQSDFDKIDIEISPTLGAAAPPALNSNSNVTIQYDLSPFSQQTRFPLDFVRGKFALCFHDSRCRHSSTAIRFNCKVNSGAAFVSMSLTVDPFDPIVFAWYKVCSI